MARNTSSRINMSRLLDTNYTPVSMDEVVVLTAMPQVSAGERAFLEALMQDYVSRIVVDVFPVDIATIPGPKGYAAGNLQYALSSIRHGFTAYEPKEDGAPEQDTSLMGQLRWAGVKDLPFGERKRRMNLGLYASNAAHQALKGLVALASMEAARQRGVQLPSH